MRVHDRSNSNSNQSLKDILYLIATTLGVIVFFRTLKKRDYGMLNYKTDFGNEVEPYLICLKGDLYNLSINNEERAIALDKFPANATPTYDQRKATPNAQIETAAFFPLLKEREFIVVSNHKLDMKPLLFSYEDKYGNHYRQSFSFDETEIGREDRLKRINRSCYKLTRRKYKVFWIWLPLIARHV